METETSNLITIVIAVVAFFCPLITKIIDVITQISFRKADLKEKRKSEAYSKYIESTVGFLLTENTFERYDYETAYYKALLYAPRDIQPKMEELNKLISEKKYKEGYPLMSEIIKRLNKS